MTEEASKIETPEDMNNGKNIPEQAAIAAKAPPRANDPVSPIDTDALYRLWSRNPKQAPAIEAPNIERSGLKKKYRVKVVSHTHYLHSECNAFADLWILIETNQSKLEELLLPLQRKPRPQYLQPIRQDHWLLWLSFPLKRSKTMSTIGKVFPSKLDLMVKAREPTFSWKKKLRIKKTVM